MEYIVFDLEWNQAPNEEALVTEPVFLDGEIIEIGAVKLSEQFKIVDERKIYIRPQYYTRMHHKIASLTGISDRQLEKEGKPFPEAFREFQEWCGQDYGYMTWSDSDLPVLINNMLLHGLDISDLPPCFDAQRMFDRELMREDRQYSLDAALEVLGEKGDKAHDALHDARNTVIVCNHLDLETYIEEYESRVFSEQPCLNRYDSVSELLKAPEVMKVVCPWCGETMEAENWVSLKGHRFMAMASCGEEDEFLVVVSCHRCPRGGYQASRLLYEMSDDLWDQYQDLLELQGNAQPV